MTLCVHVHVPVDHSRVKLLPTDDEDEGSDYINANYMPVTSSTQQYHGHNTIAL